MSDSDIEATSMPVVLVIDDNDDERQIIVTFLRYFGYVVVDAAEGARGLVIAKSWHPALAIVDLAMPGISGIDVAIAIRGDTDLHGMGLIAVSAHAEYRAPAERAGFDLFVTKPFDPDLLFHAVRRLLNRDPGDPRASTEVDT